MRWTANAQRWAKTTIVFILCHSRIDELAKLRQVQHWGALATPTFDNRLSTTVEYCASVLAALAALERKNGSYRSGDNDNHFRRFKPALVCEIGD
jgi:hypothetical protein